jgi:hypothetical protein
MKFTEFFTFSFSTKQFSVYRQKQDVTQAERMLDENQLLIPEANLLV